MDSFGARFSEAKYIKVDIDFESGDNVVTMVTENRRNTGHNYRCHYLG